MSVLHFLVPFYCLRLQYTFRGVTCTSDVARPVQTVDPYNPIYQIKAYRTGYQAINQQFWKLIVEFFTTSKCERPNQLLKVTCQSEFCLSLIYVSLSFLAQSAKKKQSAICHIQFQCKVTEHFRNRIKKIWSVRTKIALIENIFRKKNSQTRFCCACVNLYPLSKFVGNRTNSLWVLAFYSARFKWENWFEKTTLNMSIKNFNFRPKLKNVISPPIFNLFQWFFYIRDFTWTITLTEK